MSEISSAPGHPAQRGVANVWPIIARVPPIPSCHSPINRHMGVLGASLQAIFANTPCFSQSALTAAERDAVRRVGGRQSLQAAKRTNSGEWLRDRQRSSGVQWASRCALLLGRRRPITLIEGELRDLSVQLSRPITSRHRTSIIFIELQGASSPPVLHNWSLQGELPRLDRCHESVSASFSSFVFNCPLSSWLSYLLSASFFLRIQYAISRISSSVLHTLHITCIWSYFETPHVLAPSERQPTSNHVCATSCHSCHLSSLLVRSWLSATRRTDAKSTPR